MAFIIWNWRVGFLKNNIRLIAFQLKGFDVCAPLAPLAPFALNGLEDLDALALGRGDGVNMRPITGRHLDGHFSGKVGQKPLKKAKNRVKMPQNGQNGSKNLQNRLFLVIFHDFADGLPRREAHDEMRINTPPAHMRGYSMGSPLSPQKH